MKAPSPPSDDYQNVAELCAALFRFLGESERIARAYELTSKQHILLLMIKGAPDGSECATVHQIAERMRIADSTARKLVRAAEQAGLLERVKPPTRGRTTYLRATPEGSRRLGEVVAELRRNRRALARLLRTIEPDDHVLPPLISLTTPAALDGRLPGPRYDEQRL